VTGLAWGVLAAVGVHLLWARPSGRPRRLDPSVLRRRLRSGRLPVAATLVGTVLGALAIGGPVSLAVGALAGACSVVGQRSVGAARRDQARRLWPSLLEEIRVLTTSGGRSIPRALLEAGARTTPPTADAFAGAQQAWRVSADFDRTMAVLKEQLAEPSTDLVAETLLVAHELGGADVGRRLARLAEDRRRDLAARDLAVATLAGARFARRFVIIVPLGMAVAGQAVGTGRAAFASPSGQAVGLLAAGLVAGCWMWAGSLLRLPDEPRVFAS
jgi:tight adherence protein B